MSAFLPITSASPPTADLPDGVAEGPFLTHSGHCLILSLRRDCLTLSRVGFPLGDEALGLGELSGGHLGNVGLKVYWSRKVFLHVYIAF